MAERMGFPLMPWQRLVAEVGGELDPDTGLPAYRDVVVTVPRQSGKTTLVLAWELQRALGWGSPQRIVYSAQTGSDARKKLIEDQVPILEPRKAKLGIRRILKGMGNEAIEFRNGSRIVLMASGDDAGHGKTVDLGIKDEFFSDFDDRRDQALGPAMITRPSAQKLTTSTAGTDASVPLNQLVERGRQAVLSGQTHGIAYFEWSADPDADPDDPEIWWGCMPALGITMTEEAVAHERDVTFAGKPGEFRRAYLNIATKSSERVIPIEPWDLANDPDHTIPEGSQDYGIDINEDRSGGCIVACGGGVVEVLPDTADSDDPEPGVGWMVERAKAINDKRRGRWAVDAAASSPAASLIPELRAAGLEVVEIKGGDMPSACAGIFDDIADRKVLFRRHPRMDAAVAGAAKRVIGDAWVWGRKSSHADISPLVAASIAWLLSKRSAPEPGFVALDDYLDEE